MEVRNNVDEACRLCLHGEGRISVFEENPKCSITPESIYDCVSVKITKEDRLPKGICENCLSNVKNWCIFKNTCDKTQETLNGWLNCNKLGGDLKEAEDGKLKGLFNSTTVNPFEINHGSENSVLPVPALPKLLEPDACLKENQKVGKVSEAPKNLSEESTGEISSTLCTEEENKQSSVVSSTKEIADSFQDNNVVPLNDSMDVDNVESQNTPKGFLKSTESVMALCNELQESVQNKALSNSIEPMEVTCNDVDDGLPKVSLPTSSDNLSSSEINDCFSAINSSVDAVEAILEKSSNEEKSSDPKPDSIDTGVLTCSQSGVTPVSDSEASKCLDVRLNETSDQIEASPSEKVSCAAIESKDSGANDTSEDSRGKLSENKVIPDTTTETTPKENEAPKTDSSTDSDKENSIPNSVTPANDKEKQKIPESLETSTEGENQSLSDLRIESISTLTLDTSEFLDSQEAKTSSENNTTTDKVVKEVSETKTTESSNKAVDGSSAESAPAEGQTSEPEVISEQLSNPSSVQDNITDEDRSEINVNDHLEVQMNSRTDPDQEIIFSQMMIQNIKQEPIDTHETMQPSGHSNPIYPIRVKSEFSSYDYEDNTSDEIGNNSSVSGQENKCDICNRKYSSLSNYLKHLQTKVHLYNASLGPSENMMQPLANDASMSDYLDSRMNYSDSYSEDSRLSGYSNDSPMLRSRLCAEDYMQPSINRFKHSMIRQAQPRLPYPPSSLSKLPRRKEKCKLCNTQFTYISEMRRHLLSKKHKDNERLLRDNDHMMRENERMIRISERMFREKQRYMRERALYSRKEEAPPPPPPQQPEKNQSPFICPIENCHYSCQKGNRLLAHMRTHGIGQPSAAPSPQPTKESDNASSKPKLSLRQQELLKKELEKRKSNVFSEQIVVEPLIHDYKCDGCSKTFLRESGLKKHTYYCSALLANQQGEEEYDDDVEEEVEEEEEEEEEDPPKLSDNLPDNLQMKKMHCPICNLTFAARSVFISHVQIYHKGSALESGLFRPKKTAIKSNKMRVKIRKGHSYVCNHCGKKFNLLSSLNFHLKVHTTKHICKICKKGYDSRRAFMDHCRLHFLPPGSKQTLCHKCFRVFKTRAEFSHHRKHDMCSIKLKIYSCNICQHSFKDPKALEDHKVRFHNDVLDVSDEEETRSVDRRPMLQNVSMNRQNFEAANENRPSTSSKLHSSNLNQSSNSTKSDPYLHCDVCDRDYATLASLKKHMWKYHQTKPLLNQRFEIRKNNVIQAKASKCWKCKHCKRVFGTRRMLVVHLKKCKYNAFEVEAGMCLQCGKWCESGKSRICRFCLPDLNKAPKAKKSLPESNFLMTPKSEFMINPKQEVNSAPARILNPSFPGIMPKIKKPTAVGGIRLMKCPVGNKYFRSELLMIKHYSQCDGSCENRCSHCRKFFNSPKEYRVHLLNSNCYGHSRARPKGGKKLSSLKQITISQSDYSELERFRAKSSDGEASAEVSTVDSSISEENSMMELDPAMLNDPSNKAAEEKSLKIGRVCTLCNKVITMQRGLYRHIYSCFKMNMLTQESVSCKKCSRTFSKHLSMKENTASIRQHILDCHFIPYYEGEGLLEDGSPSEVPPPLLCYVCSFGFSNNDNLRRHILEHRSRKDEINNVVLLLEAELLSEKRLNSGSTSYHIQILPESTETLCSLPVRKNNMLRFKVPGMHSLEPRKVIRKKLLECEKCNRKFTNRNKFLRHKKVHGIVTQSVFHEVSDNYLEFIADHAQPPPDTIPVSESTPPPPVPTPPPPPSN